MIFQLQLLEKKLLTHDVFFLAFTTNEPVKTPLFGQFMTFLLRAGGRAYSIANSQGSRFEFIIKRLENGKGGSKEVCDMNIGESLRAVGPAGHFLLREHHKNRLFLGTGTGFAPLYFQILGSYEKKLGGKNHFVFGVKEFRDVFLEETLQSMKATHRDFDYTIFLSREQKRGYQYGRITEFITSENVVGYEEFYLCGSHAMVVEAHDKLIALGIDASCIFSEKY